MYTQRSVPPPVVFRSRLMLEAASEMIGMGGWPHRQARIAMRDRDTDEWGPTIFGSDSPDAIWEVAQGAVDIAIVNPGCVLGLASRGTGPFKEPIALRAIATLAEYDQLVFAVAGSTGIASLDDIKARQYPLRVSLRGQRDHGVHLVIDQVLQTAGFSLDDIRAWGGEVRYDPGLPALGKAERIKAVQSGDVDAIFEESKDSWVPHALALGMRLLPLESHHLQPLESQGFRRGLITQEEFPDLPGDIPALDFSGFTIYTREDVSDEVVTAFCYGLEAIRERVPYRNGEPLPLDRMCRDTPEGPLYIPLHPAAERFWRERGYL